MTTWDMQFRALPGIPLIEPGDDLPALIAKAAQADGFTFADGDVVVVAQKVVSKAEGRIVRLDEVTPTPRARGPGARAPAGMPGCASSTWTSPRRSLEVRGRHVVTVHRLGFIGTGAGVDMSNVADRAEGYAVLLPVDPDASARAIRAGLRELTGAPRWR